MYSFFRSLNGPSSLIDRQTRFDGALEALSVALLYCFSSFDGVEALSFALVHCVERSLSTVFVFSKRYPSVKCMFGVLLFNLIWAENFISGFCGYWWCWCVVFGYVILCLCLELLLVSVCLCTHVACTYLWWETASRAFILVIANLMASWGDRNVVLLFVFGVSFAWDEWMSCWTTKTGKKEGNEKLECAPTRDPADLCMCVVPSSDRPKSVLNGPEGGQHTYWPLRVSRIPQLNLSRFYLRSHFLYGSIRRVLCGLCLGILRDWTVHLSTLVKNTYIMLIITPTGFWSL